MSRIPDGILSLIRDRTPMPALVERRVRLRRSGRLLIGLCPFHGETAPSFACYPDHYHCFGCGETGDAFSWLMRTEGLKFREAAEQLATAAGVTIPEDKGHQGEQGNDNFGVIAVSASHFSAALRNPSGAPALAYLHARGITDDTIARYGIGWSGSGAVPGISREAATAAGLLREDGGWLYYHRVVFPIRDRLGKCLSFTARALDDRHNKYLNGPETVIFRKRSTLFGADVARVTAARTGTVVMVEGATDVCLCHQAGLAAVAPLGTAVSEEHILQAWAIAPELILCFDGDAAGRKATHAAVLTALPHLRVGRILRVAFLAGGEDPGAIGARDPEALTTVVRDAGFLVDALYRLLQPEGEQTPDRRTAHKRALIEAANRITERDLAASYRADLLDRWFRTRRTRTMAHPDPVSRPRPLPSAADSEIARTLIAAVINHPEIIDQVDEELRSLNLPRPWGSVRDAVLACVDDSREEPTRDDILFHLRHVGLTGFAGAAVSTYPLALPLFATLQATHTEALAGWKRSAALLGLPALEAEIMAALESWTETGSPEAVERYQALLSMRQALLYG